MLRVCTFKWGDKYTIQHVRTLFSMVERNLKMDKEYVLITDQPDEDRDPNGCWRTVPLWQEMRDAKLCGVRLRAFGPDMVELIGPRFVWIDLDVVIVGDITKMLSRTEPFIALQPPRPPMPYNGSMVMMDAGSHPEVLSRWSMQEYWKQGNRLGLEHKISAGTVSDEGWMWYTLGSREPVWSRQDGVYYFRRDLDHGRVPLPPNARIVVMNGRGIDPADPKWQSRCPWIRNHYR